MSHTDINKNTLIQRGLPEGLRPYALLMRLDRPIGTWLLLLPGWWAILLASGAGGGLGARDFGLLVLFAVGAVAMRGAGCVVNDLWDRDLDRQVERTALRPLALGSVSVRQAAVFLAVLLAVGCAILWQMNWATRWLGILSLPLIAAYPLMKRITWWPQAFLGITFNFGALMGWTAVTGALHPAAVLLYLAGIAWTLGYDTIYAHQDIVDDERVGIKSSARRLGEKSPAFVRGAYGLTLAGIVGAFILAGAGWFSIILLALPGAHLWWQARRWTPDDPASALAIFRSNRDFGLLVALAAIL